MPDPFRMLAIITTSSTLFATYVFEEVRGGNTIPLTKIRQPGYSPSIRTSLSFHFALHGILQKTTFILSTRVSVFLQLTIIVVILSRTVFPNIFLLHGTVTRKHI